MAGPHDPSRSPGVWFPPPLFFATGLAIGFFVHRRRPLLLGADALPLLFEVSAVALIATGLGLMGWAALTFRRAHTTILPDRGSNSLAFGGPYRFTRNPMYLGMTGIYVGLTLLLDSVWPLVFLPLVLFMIDRWVIAREEGHLLARFGAEYEAYRRRVGRWL